MHPCSRTGVGIRVCTRNRLVVYFVSHSHSVNTLEDALCSRAVEGTRLNRRGDLHLLLSISVISIVVI